MKKALLNLVLFLAVGNFAFAQDQANSNAPVNVSLIKGLAISASAGDLQFEEVIVTPDPQTTAITNEDGQQFLITGHPNRQVTITYDQTVTLDNDVWVGINGGTESTLTFTTNTADRTGSDPTYSNPAEIASGGTANLVNVTGTGTLYIWVGGEIQVPGNQAHGDYVGEFNIEVAY